MDCGAVSAFRRLVLMSGMAFDKLRPSGIEYGPWCLQVDPIAVFMLSGWSGLAAIPAAA